MAFWDGVRGLFSRKASSLLEVQGGTSQYTGVRSPVRNSVASTLTPAKLGALLRRADRGDVEAYFVLAEEMEEREPHYRSVLGTRKLGVSGAPVLVESASDSAHDTAIAEDVEQLVQRPEFEGLVLDLMDGVAKGFAANEIIWKRDAQRWEPQAYEFRSQRHFVFDEDTLSKPRLRTIDNSLGEELKPYSWIVHTPKLTSGLPLQSGIARTVTFAYAAKRFTIQDWMTFLEVFGMPIRLGKFPASMAEQKTELLAAVQAIGAEAAGVIPEEMNIELIERKGGQGSGGGVFLESCEYWDKQTSKVVLGQTMTSDDGASLAQSKTHERVRFDIRKADARSVSATVNRDLVKVFVDLNYGPQKDYPRVKIQADEPEDTTALMANVKTFVAMGGKVQASEIRDRIGLMEPEDGADLLEPEAVINAKAAPKPEPGVDAKGDKGKAPAGEGDDLPDEPAREANRARFAADRPTQDVVDVLADDALEHFEPLIDQNVGRLLELIQGAESYEAARALLDKLAEDEGEELALDALTALLARKTFQTRGIGSATDDTEI